MHKVYLDHSIVACEKFWPGLEVVLTQENVRLAVSLWNLLEIAQDADRNRQKRRSDFLQRCNLICMVERLNIQEQEVGRFLWQNYFGVQPKDLQIFTPHLSVVESYQTGQNVQIGLTPAQYIRSLARENRHEIEKAKESVRHGLSVLQSIDNKTLKACESKRFKAWIEPLAPKVDPDSKPLASATRTELVEYCWKNHDQFLSECRALAAEDALAKKRTSDSKRKPVLSDGPDLQHSVVALAYCDSFVVQDGYARQCAEFAAARMSKLGAARVLPDPSSLRGLLRGNC